MFLSNLYRTYCNRGVPSRATAMDTISISWAGFLEFINDSKLVDETSERCKMSDMDNVFVAANLEVTEEAKQQDNPDRSLTRFEFLECIIRIAINKYATGKSKISLVSTSVRCHECTLDAVCETPAQAFEKLMQEHLVPMTPQDSNEFRTNYLYTEAVSDCLVEYVVMVRRPDVSHRGTNGFGSLRTSTKRTAASTAKWATSRAWRSKNSSTSCT